METPFLVFDDVGLKRLSVYRGFFTQFNRYLPVVYQDFIAAHINKCKRISIPFYERRSPGKCVLTIKLFKTALKAPVGPGLQPLTGCGFHKKYIWYVRFFSYIFE